MGSGGTLLQPAKSHFAVSATLPRVCDSAAGTRLVMHGGRSVRTTHLACARAWHPLVTL